MHKWVIFTSTVDTVDTAQWAIPENIHTAVPIPQTAFRISEREGGFFELEFRRNGEYLRLEIRRHGGISQGDF